MSEDWDTVVIRKKPTRASDAKKASNVNAAIRSGAGVETNERFNGSGNRQHQSTKDTAKLDRETEELKHATVSVTVSKALMQARQAKGMSQKELATKVNEKPQIVNEYESGKAIPNNQVLGKLERALGVKLRGKNIGAPLVQGPKKK
ncbi:endothelial differentiation-like factor 1 [Sphaeroforma arctica JP610]|uniref:Endothelial differentiation-like factor 1 n=1 Tax=Sphaeroforma arctica JP610 TaxID=667725 RepID=A0A0L0GDD7_9EUKA|nr:endothelial differentiation-like factor 1 [Sphaeroforma arctica JP610]KNC87027.1 endothelial differentiation-like factor 1 [Sphaeroforma arctica JP610]|eukprot:XP_014160929.1 endothelial differentiation-like factor 1 [Sphaeroforma arctica JP610]